MFNLARLIAAALLFCLLLAAGCGGPEIRETPSAPMKNMLRARIIIGFSVSTESPSERRFVEHLARDAGARLSYVRPMSGNVHVFEIEGLRDEEELQLALERLGRRPDISHVAQDRVLHGQ